MAPTAAPTDDGDTAAPTKSPTVKSLALTTGKALLAGGDLTLAYEPTSDAKVKFTVTAAGQRWFALGFNSAGMKMDGIDAVILKGVEDRRRLADNTLYTITGYGVESIAKKTCSELVVTEVTMDEKSTSMSFEYDPASECFRSGFGCTKDTDSGAISCEPSNIVYSWGQASSDSNPSFSKHVRVGGGSINFADAGETSVADTRPTAVKSGFVAHATLMVLGWGAMIPTGVVTARFFKARKKGRRPDCWFQMHRSVQVVGLLLAIGGLIAVSTTNAGQHVFDRPSDPNAKSFLEDPKGHGILGMVVMVLGIQQVRV
jgi:hypothetical protein